MVRILCANIVFLWNHFKGQAGHNAPGQNTTLEPKMKSSEDSFRKSAAAVGDVVAVGPAVPAVVQPMESDRAHMLTVAQPTSNIVGEVSNMISMTMFPLRYSCGKLLVACFPENDQFLNLNDMIL